MPDFNDLLAAAFADADLPASDLPAIDLYMDQILTLLEDGLAANRRRPDERIVTKTMINNYTKERLILPVKGKKYTRTQLMQLLCVLELKQTLALGDIKSLVAQQDDAPVDYEAVYEQARALTARLRETLPALLRETLGDAPLTGRAEQLTLALTLSAGASFMRRGCEALADMSGGQAAYK